MGAASILMSACSGDDGGAEPKKVTLGSVLGVSDAAPDYADVQRQSEELTAQCMIDAGWEYIPVQYPETVTLANESDEDVVARIKLMGLGFAYELLNDGTDEAVGDDPWEDFVNPNDAYVASLSADEKAAYDDAMYGTDEEQSQSELTTTRFDPTTGSQWSVTGSRSGCAGEAFAAVMDKGSTQTTEDAVAIKVFWDDLQSRVKADPRTIKLDDRWASCMRDSGYDYESPAAFRDSTYEEFNSKVTAIAGADVTTDPMAGWTQDQIDEFFATATQDEIDALLNTSPDLTADQRTRLEAVLAQEIAVALADHDCTASLKDDAAAIYADVEEKYVIEHEDELTALGASLASGE